MLGVDHIRDYMTDNNIEGEIIILGQDEARTSLSAAKAVGCPVSQIAKAIVLVGKEPFIVILSGDKRVALSKASAGIGYNVKLADAKAVLEETGFQIGGVPPFGHWKPVAVFMDRSLDRFVEVFCSAGSPEALLKIRLDTLRRVTGAQLVDFSG